MNFYEIFCWGVARPKDESVRFLSSFTALTGTRPLKVLPQQFPKLLLGTGLICSNPWKWTRPANVCVCLCVCLLGAGASGGGVASSSDVHHRHFSDDRRVGDSRLERDPPQDEHHQRARTWLPWPQLPRQCHRWVGCTGRRGQLTNLCGALPHPNQPPNRAPAPTKPLLGSIFVQFSRVTPS